MPFIRPDLSFKDFSLTQKDMIGKNEPVKFIEKLIEIEKLKNKLENKLYEETTSEQLYHRKNKI